MEDESIVAMDIQDQLTRLGYDAESVQTCGEAMQRVAAAKPDLVLMDIRFNGAEDGVDTAREIWRLFHTPIVFLTAHSDEATLDRAKLIEPFGYMLKPFEERELKMVIELALHKHRVEQERKQLVSDIILELSKGR